MKKYALILSILVASCDGRTAAQTVAGDEFMFATVPVAVSEATVRASTEAIEVKLEGMTNPPKSRWPGTIILGYGEDEALVLRPCNWFRGKEGTLLECYTHRNTPHPEWDGRRVVAYYLRFLPHSTDY